MRIEQEDYVFKIATDYPTLTPVDLKVFDILVAYHNKYETNITVGMVKIAELINVTRKTVGNSIAKLIDVGLITRIKEGKGSYKNSSQYFINKYTKYVTNSYELPKYVTNSYSISILYIYNTLYNTKTYNNYITSRLAGTNKKRGMSGMNQIGLFSGAPVHKNKKAMTAEELFREAKSEQIKLTYSEFAKAYKYIHMQVLDREVGGKLSADEVGLTLKFLKDKYNLEGGQVFAVLERFLERVNKSANYLEYVSLRMIRTGKDMHKLLEDAIENKQPYEFGGPEYAEKLTKMQQEKADRILKDKSEAELEKLRNTVF